MVAAKHDEKTSREKQTPAINEKTIANSCAKLLEASEFGLDMVVLATLIRTNKITLRAGLSFLEKCNKKQSFVQCLDKPPERLEPITDLSKPMSDIIKHGSAVGYGILLEAAINEKYVWMLCRFLQDQEYISDEVINDIIDSDPDAFRILTEKKLVTETKDVLEKAVFVNWKAIFNIPTRLWSDKMIERILSKAGVSIFDVGLFKHVNSETCVDYAQELIGYVWSKYHVEINLENFRDGNSYDFDKIISNIEFVRETFDSVKELSN